MASDADAREINTRLKKTGKFMPEDTELYSDYVSKPGGMPIRRTETKQADGTYALIPDQVGKTKPPAPPGYGR